jgi:hypothetical protein
MSFIEENNGVESQCKSDSGKVSRSISEVCKDFKDYSLGNRQYSNEGGSRLGRATQNRFHPQHIPESRDRIPDSRAMNAADILRLVNSNENLDEEETDALIKLLQRYDPFLTSKPGRCILLEYEFKFTNEKPVTSYTQTVSAIRDQIRQLIEDDIIEISDSPSINPLIVVSREGKSLQIYVDARHTNALMQPDRANMPPFNELLQRFHGASFLSSIDLSSAFLQIPLAEKSRPYTAFPFD